MKTLPLTKGKVALVDNDNFEYLNQWKWRVQSKNHNKNEFYVARSIRGQKPNVVYLHRLIMNVTDSKIQVDHINGNSLDNRKQNLRIANSSQNSRNIKPGKRNTSGYKGVSWSKKTKKWRAKIYCNKKYIHIGHFENKEDAAKAYNEAAKLYFKDFAYLNEVK